MPLRYADRLARTSGSTQGRGVPCGMASLPLFPLSTVLMPGALIPLQIFEPRYVALLHDLVRHQQERAPVFGVVAIRKGYEVGEHGVRALHTVGCAAQVVRAADLGDQRYLVVSQGTTRFRLGALDESAGTPYATAEVTWLEEAEGESLAVTVMAARLREDIAAYRRAIGAEAVEPPGSDRELSYWLPDAIGLELADRQQLLASPDTETRLRLGARLVRRERTLAATLTTVTRPLAGPMSPN